jgi:hypothetical protein
LTLKRVKLQEDYGARPQFPVKKTWGHQAAPMSNSQDLQNKAAHASLDKEQRNFVKEKCE